MMTNAELKRMAARLRKGCPTKGVSLSPWGAQLQADAHALLAEVEAARAAPKKGRAA